jgi:molybdopterin converting factor small subunit
MKIRIKARFFEDGTELETDGSTLREVLGELSKQYPKERFYNREREEVNFEYFIEVNGKDHESLPGELDAKLKEGDEIEIYTGIDYPDD